jgi:acyl dehydratase
MNPQLTVGNYYEDLAPGLVIKHATTKTIFESDNNLFCLLTMNPHPAHVDIEYARQSQHGALLVVGTLVLSLAVGITVQDISYRAIANLSYSDVQHLAPVFVNDTIRVETTVLDRSPSQSRPDRGRVTVMSSVYNQHGTAVLTFKRTILVRRRPYVASTP